MILLHLLLLIAVFNPFQVITAEPPHPKRVTNWPSRSLKVGQITAVSVNLDGNPVIFHRDDRIWGIGTFNSAYIYQEKLGPIRGNTILTLSARDGSILSGTGAGIFYLPHGLTIDDFGNTWATDVAMHQVFKFKPGSLSPVITLGKLFQPGSSSSHLCQPTSVVVASTGEFFVADGYCNNRVLKFNAVGNLLRIIPNPPEFISLQIPHGLALIEQRDQLCIADRENERVVCVKAELHGMPKSTRQPITSIQDPSLGRVFAVASHGDFLFAVSGAVSTQQRPHGYTIDPLSKSIVDQWGEFVNPHSIAVTRNGSTIYVTEIGPNVITKFELK